MDATEMVALDSLLLQRLKEQLARLARAMICRSGASSVSVSRMWHSADSAIVGVLRRGV